MNTDSYASRLIMEHVGHYLKPILGPDIAIQKNIGLSIQLPEDSSSLLPIHSDVFSSDCSPYELVVWIPLTTCFDTKSMFYLPFKSFKTLSDYLLCVEKNDLKNSSALLDNVQSDIQFLSTQPPEVTLFCHSIWHGNVVNKTCETRVSINVRVKNVFTPYRGKKLGDFFEIGSLSPLSQLFTDIDSIYDCK